jgi:hypothetical protein
MTMENMAVLANRHRAPHHQRACVRSLARERAEDFAAIEQVFTTTR